MIDAAPAYPSMWSYSFLVLVFILVWHALVQRMLRHMLALQNTMHAHHHLVFDEAFLVGLSSVCLFCAEFAAEIAVAVHVNSTDTLS